MAEPTSVALAAASIPPSADIARAGKFVREHFLHDGEDPAVALAAGTPRRRALDQALAELDAKAKHPSTAWRREFSLLLGLERVLSEDEPKLVDGTVLSAHQVDALSGTLTALLAAAQTALPVAVEVIDAPEPLEVDAEIEADSGAGDDDEIEAESSPEDDAELEALEEPIGEDDEPQD